MRRAIGILLLTGLLLVLVWPLPALAGGLQSTGPAASEAALRADFNGDGAADLAIGAPGENSSSGVVHVLYGSGTGLAAAGSQLWSQDSPGIAGGGRIRARPGRRGLQRRHSGRPGHRRAGREQLRRGRARAVWVLARWAHGHRQPAVVPGQSGDRRWSRTRRRIRGCLGRRGLQRRRCRRPGHRGAGREQLRRGGARAVRGGDGRVGRGRQPAVVAEQPGDRRGGRTG
jgi:hypothetical protein